MNQMQKYFADGIDHLLDDGVLAIRERVSGAVGWALFLAFVLSCGHRRLKAVFQPEKMSEAEKAVPALSVETFQFMTDEEVALAFGQLDMPEFILAMRQAGVPSGQRFEAIIAKMEDSEVATREQAKAEIARKAQEDANRARKVAEEKAELDRKVTEAKRLADEKSAKERSEREAKAQEDREAKFRQYVLCEFVGSKDIIQLATRKLEKIKEFRGPDGITPEWQLAIIRDVSWKCEGELRATPSFLQTDKVGLEEYIANLAQEAVDLQPETSKVITSAYDRQLKLARKVLADITAGKVIRFPDGGRACATSGDSDEATKERAKREAKREERRQRDRAIRAAAKTSQGGGKKN